MSSDARRRAWVLASGTRYWPRGSEAIAALPMATVPLADAAPGALTFIDLPEWAADLGIDGRLLAFADCLSDGEGERWRRCDWLAAAWHMLTGSHEREHEQRHGPILSYSFRLPGTLQPMFEHAWVNRIFLFLRRWAARESAEREASLFGPLPRASIVLTHDIDAVRLTPEIRLKQTVFQLVNALRSSVRGRWSVAARRVGDAGRFAFSRGDFRTLARVRDMERAAGVRSILHLYGGPPGFRRGSPRRVLMDPGYDVGSDYVRAELRAFVEGGWTVGLHQSFDAWDDAVRMSVERGRVEAAAGAPVPHCRQHWLHFSWAKTWRAQEQAGLASDSTLGFNDRSGLRAGHALRFHPWDFGRDAPMLLSAVPMVCMDSHFYDYGQLDRDAIASAMRRWLGEIEAVGGEVTVNWHTHTITAVYGWAEGFEELLSQLGAAARMRASADLDDAQR